MTRSTLKPSRLTRLWPLLGFLGGWLIALGDLAFFHATEIEMRLGGRDVTVFVTPEHQVRTFSDPREALAALAAERFEILVSDLKMPGLSGLEVLRRARAGDPELQVILITAHADVPTAVAAMREGAFDFLEKPFDNDELRALVRRVARSRSTVLITGESGTGKEIVARALHFHSDRVAGPFVAVNAKALAAGVLESELFGHERGAFTGAHRARAGLFERAHGGSLFLDEIGEISEDFQAKLLRAAHSHIRDVLTEVRGSRVQAARRLGVERTTLYRLMRRLGLE